MNKNWPLCSPFSVLTTSYNEIPARNVPNIIKFIIHLLSTPDLNLILEATSSHHQLAQHKKTLYSSPASFGVFVINDKACTGFPISSSIIEYTKRWRFNDVIPSNFDETISTVKCVSPLYCAVPL